MQDCYVGDIGDYGKYGLLRTVCGAGLSLSVNWYRVLPGKAGKQDDGKFVQYLSMPQAYRDYDPELFDALRQIVGAEQDRRIGRIEEEGLFPAACFAEVIGRDRPGWHREALKRTAGTDVVFLDPDNGLETLRMHRTGRGRKKHVKWPELRDYYARGQNVILYQHRPQMTSKERCIEDMLSFQRDYLQADGVRLLEFPRYTNRFYFFFLHGEKQTAFQDICRSMAREWGAGGFCREIILE